MKPIRLKILPAAAAANNLSVSASPGAGAIVLTALAAGPIDPAIPGPNVKGVNMGLGRIVILTSGGNDTGVTFTLTGTDQNGLAVTENVTGASGAAAASTKYYTSLTSVTHTGSVAGTLTIGTVNTTASAQTNTLPLDLYTRTPAMCEVTVSGTISYTVNWTADAVVDGSPNLQNNAYFATPQAQGQYGSSSTTALTAQSASKYDALPPGASGVTVLIPTYTTGGFVVLNVIQPANSGLG